MASNKQQGKQQKLTAKQKGERVRAAQEREARAKEQREKALDKLLPMQQGDFEGIYEAMEGCPVTIRFLDPPLHEFVPTEEADIELLAKDMGKTVADIKAIIATSAGDIAGTIDAVVKECPSVETLILVNPAGAGLTPMEEDPFYQRVTGPLSYPGGEHVTVRYYPYYGLSGYEEAADTVYTLVLSQPATQGEEGIWCVDRWVDQNGTRYLVVPEADQPMDDYYAALQDACDAGDRPDLLDPVAVALDFEEDWSGRDLSPDAFVLEGASDLSELFDLPLAMVELENGVGG